MLQLDTNMDVEEVRKAVHRYIEDKYWGLKHTGTMEDAIKSEVVYLLREFFVVNGLEITFAVDLVRPEWGTVNVDVQFPELKGCEILKHGPDANFQYSYSVVSPRGTVLCAHLSVWAALHIAEIRYKDERE